MLPRVGPHVFVDDFQTLQLRDDDRHHLERVLRVRPGDPLTVSDGAGSWCAARFGDELEPVGESHYLAQSPVQTTVAFALVKGGRPELVVQKLTELGIDRVRPFAAEHSVVRWDDAKAKKQHTRFLRIAREAAMQSKRVWLPEIGELASFADVAQLPGAVMADLDAPSWRGDEHTVLVGPEGGWSEAERAAPIERRQLRDTVLRAETAAIAAGVLLG